MARKPPDRGANPEVSFNWPGQRRRQDPGVLDTPLAARRQRQQAATDAAPPPPPPPPPPATTPAKPPATRGDATAAGARERWIVTELRRQAITTESALRDVSDRVDQLSRTLRQIVDYLPRLQPRAPGTGASQHTDAVVSQRLDELEARIEARFDELAGAATMFRAGASGGGRPAAPVDTSAIKTQVREGMADVTKQLADMGDRLRAELVTGASQAEARLNRDRDQLREVLNHTMGKLNELVGGTVSRDDLRQYWVEMAAKLAKQQDVVVAEREQLRQDLAARLDQMSAEREQLRLEVGERLARAADAAAVRERGAASGSTVGPCWPR